MLPATLTLWKWDTSVKSTSDKSVPQQEKQLSSVTSSQNVGKWQDKQCGVNEPPPNPKKTSCCHHLFCHLISFIQKGKAKENCLQDRKYLSSFSAKNSVFFWPGNGGSKQQIYGTKGRDQGLKKKISFEEYFSQKGTNYPYLTTTAFSNTKKLSAIVD